jgi:multiple sugar transport system permease protein
MPQIGLALLLTAWFTDVRSKIKGMGFFKVVFYMPNIITAATVAILFNALFGSPTGPINDILISLHIQDGPVQYLVNKSTAQGIVIFIQFWMWFGYTMVTLISGVIGIDPAIFEAAEIDGANRVQTFLFITLPCIRTIMLFTLVTSLIGGLNMFDIPKCFLDGGPDSATLTTSVFIYNQAFSGSYIYNKAAAASMIMFVIIVFFSSFLFYILRDKDEAALKKMKKRELREAKKRLAEGVM